MIGILLLIKKEREYIIKNIFLDKKLMSYIV